MQNVNFRAVRAEDAPQIAIIYNYYVEETDISFETEALSDEQMRERIVGLVGHNGRTHHGASLQVDGKPEGDHFPYIVCEEEGVILGYAYAHPWKERAAYCHTLETTVYVRRGYERRGLGRALMLRLIDECRNWTVHGPTPTDGYPGVHALIACITGGNTASIALHTALGFTQASHFRQVGRKHGRWLDVVDLILLL